MPNVQVNFGGLKPLTALLFTTGFLGGCALVSKLPAININSKSKRIIVLLFVVEDTTKNDAKSIRIY
ncbi:MAG: hypothetical protein IPP48_00500 [Chitinophagaceae bacterium]|nr:hypothetical protein [Chitinophagaceae bacterium]